MTITSLSTKDFTRPAVPAQATNVETTHLIFNFTDKVGYIRQIFTDSNGDRLGVRFLQISGAKYTNVESGILTKVQKVVDGIELDELLIDGLLITEIGRSEFLTGVRS